MCGDGYVRYCRPHAAMARTLSLVLMVTRTPDTGHRVGKDSEELPLVVLIKIT